jgi:hypothetical protein
MSIKISKNEIESFKNNLNFDSNWCAYEFLLKLVFDSVSIMLKIDTKRFSKNLF